MDELDFITGTLGKVFLFLILNFRHLEYLEVILLVKKMRSTALGHLRPILFLPHHCLLV
jgi:hypothetical protein